MNNDSTKITMLPFNSFLFQALYDWLLAMDLDPILLINKTSAAAKGLAGGFIYIGANAVRDAKFDLDGFQCLASRQGRPFTVKLNWDDIIGLATSNEAAIKKMQNKIIICWCNDHWEMDMPKLYEPNKPQMHPKIKVIQARKTHCDNATDRIDEQNK